MVRDSFPVLDLNTLLCPLRCWASSHFCTSYLPAPTGFCKVNQYHVCIKHYECPIGHQKIYYLNWIPPKKRDTDAQILSSYNTFKSGAEKVLIFLPLKSMYTKFRLSTALFNRLHLLRLCL